jgi:two-component system, chemotaxis family, sensor histidine kinase and response regulator PixL
MSLNSDIRDQAYQFFIEEAQELLQIIEEGLLTLKDDRSTPRIHNLMRAAHSLKGGAASVELDTIKTIAHRLEDYFKALYSDSVNFDSQLESLLLQAFDCLRNPLVEQMEMGGFDAEFALMSAEPIFAQLEDLLGDALKEGDNTYIPSSTDLGIDIVSSIFDIDVAQGIARLTEVISNPQNFEIVGELRAQAEVFAGFAELLNLPGFGAIASTVMSAIDLHPELAPEIAYLMLEDCQAARELVLAGDREQGGSPSEALVVIATSGSIDTSNTQPIATEIADFNDIFAADSDLLAAISLESPEIAEAFSLQSIFDSETFASETSPAIDNIFGNIQVEESIEQPIDAFDAENLFDTDITILQSEQTLVRDEFESIEATDLPELDNIFDTDITNLQTDVTTVQTQEIESIPVPLFEENFDPEIAQLETDAITEVSSIDPLLENDFFNTDISGIQIDDIFGTDLEELDEDLQTSIFNAKLQTSASDETVSDRENIAEISKHLEQTLHSIEQEFSQLPALEDLSAIVSTSKQPEETKVDSTLAKPKDLVTQPTKKTEKQTVKASTQNKESTLSVRVDLSRLERMNNLIGELAINRNSLSLQNEQLQDNVKELLTRFSRFREMTAKIRETSDQMLIESEHSKISQSSRSRSTAYGRSHPQQQQQSIVRENNFDSLEMDSYNQIHTMLQGVLDEMVQLEEAVDDISLFARQSNLTIEQQSQMVSHMRDELMWARMLPLNQILQRFPRTLRDLSGKYNKPVELTMIGVGVLVDKAVLEKLTDPLMHLLRNGFDHGIESVEIRRQLGKPEQGNIEIQAYYQGNQTIVEVKDDGQGLNLERIKAKAVQNNLITAAQAASIGEDRLFDFIFEPGFSTAKKVSEISGRGVGLDVVRSQIQALKGTVTVNSTAGKGTTFTLRLPLTLTISKILVCLISSGAVSFPSDSIEEIIIPDKSQLKFSGKQRFLFWGDRLVPIHPLEELLHYNCSVAVDTSGKIFETLPAPEDWELPILLMRQGQQIVALEVERLITEQELVVKPFGAALSAPKYSFGCTILGDGTLIPVINGAVLIEEFLEPNRTSMSVGNASSQALAIAESSATIDEEDAILTSAKTAVKTIQAPTILVVDDSAALRRTLALSLEKNGYQVLQAKDGREALEQMHKHSQINLVICDVEMPNMNGFEFLGMRRKEAQLIRVPVAMLTSRSSEKHRGLATQLGANAYFTKPYIEQEFLGEIRKLLQGNRE